MISPCGKHRAKVEQAAKFVENRLQHKRDRIPEAVPLTNARQDAEPSSLNGPTYFPRRAGFFVHTGCRYANPAADATLSGVLLEAIPDVMAFFAF